MFIKMNLSLIVTCAGTSTKTFSNRCPKCILTQMSHHYLAPLMLATTWCQRYASVLNTLSCRFSVGNNELQWRGLAISLGLSYEQVTVAVSFMKLLSCHLNFTMSLNLLNLTLTWPYSEGFSRCKLKSHGQFFANGTDHNNLSC